MLAGHLRPGGPGNGVNAIGYTHPALGSRALRRLRAAGAPHESVAFGQGFIGTPKIAARTASQAVQLDSGSNQGPKSFGSLMASRIVSTGAALGLKVP
jgi:hypothetical protein